MADFIENSYVIEHRFDPFFCRHYFNDYLTVLHCHHYSALYTQLAMDCEFIDAKKMLSDSIQETAYPVLMDYYEDNGIEEMEDRIKIAEEYYSALGLGKLKILCLGRSSGIAELTHSHVDEGWIKKWGKHDKPVNYMSAGFIAAAFAAVLDAPIKSFKAVETESIVMGSEKSRFNVVSL